LVTPAVARAGMTVTVAFETTEALSAMPVVKAGGKDLAGTEFPGNSYEFGYKVAKGEADGERAIAVSFSDRAGNALEEAPGGSFVIDSTTPQVSNVAATSKKYSAQAGYNAVTLTFDSSEDVGGGLSVVVGGAATACGAWQAQSPNYTCTLEVTMGEGEGVKEISIAAVDAAGNTGFGSASVEYDFSGPVLALSVQPSGRPARLGELVTVGVSASEALDSNGIALDSGALNLGTPAGTGTSYSWTYTVKAGDEGSFNLSANATDVVGNPAVAPATGMLALDGVAPEVSNAVLDPPRVAKGGQFTLTFDVSETPGADPEVAFNNGVDVPVPMSKASSIGLSFTYTGTAPNSGSAPFYGVTVSVSDTAGNRTVASAGTVEIDNVAPGVAGLDVAPKAAKKGDTIRVVLSATETLSGPPVLTASNGTETITPAALDMAAGKLNYSYEHPLTDASPQGTFLVQGFTISDVAGNEKAVTPEAEWTFFVDSREPVVGAVTADKAKYSRVSGYDTVTVTFDCTEDVASGLTVTVGGAGMTCAAWQAQSPNYMCTYAIQSGDTGGVKPIEIKATDAAGNSAYGSGSVEYDFTNPAVISAGPGQGAYKLNDSVLYTINVSEPISGNPARPSVRVFKDGVEQPVFFGDPVSETETSFTYSKPVASGMDGTYTVTVELTDKAGNAAAGLPGIGWSVDAAPPVVTPVSLTTNNPNFNTLAKDGEVVTAVFTVNEDPPSSPTVALGGKAMSLVSKAGTGPFTFTYTRAAATADGDGAKTASVTTTDLAGNVTVQDIGGVVYDFVKPAVSSSGGTPNPAGLGKVLTYTLNASEPLVSDPVLHLTPALALSGPVQTGTLYTWTRTIDGNETQGAYTVIVDLFDLAGNADAGVAAAGFDLDRAVPAIVTGPTLNKNPPFYKVGDTVAVAFTANEDLDATLPTATINTTTPVNMSCTAGGGTNDYTCSLGRNLTSSDVPQGQVGISIVLADAAQNMGFSSATMTLDYTNPALVSASPSQAYYRGGQTIAYAVSVSEPLLGSPGRPTVRVLKDGVEQPGYFGAPSSETDTSFTYTKGVTADGVYTVQVDLADKAGNAVVNTGSPSGWTIDAAAPVVTILNPAEGTRLSRVDGFKTLLVQFDTGNENLDAVTNGVKVTAGGVDITIGCGPFSASSPNYTCTHVVDGGDTEGAKNVLVTARDAAGNETQAGVNVVYDFTPPSVPGVVAVSVVPQAGCPLTAQEAGAVSNGTFLRVLFAVSELLKDDKADWVKASLGAQEIALDYDDRESNQYVLVYNTVAGGLTVQGEHTLSVKLSDLVGNSQTVTPMVTPNIVVDTVAPGAPDVDTLDKIVYKRVPWGFDENRDGTFVPKTFRIVSGTDAVDADTAWVFAYDGSDPATAAEIGRKAVVSRTFGTMDLSRADRVDVYVAGCDAACNHSIATKVRDVEWTVTMGYKVPGSTFENPHRCETRRWFAGSLGQGDTVEWGAADGLAGRDAASLAVKGAGTWVQRSFADPSGRVYHRLAYDGTRGRVVLWGGYNNSENFLGDTWTFDGNNWTRCTPGDAACNLMDPQGDGNPARGHSPLAFDSRRGKVVLFSVGGPVFGNGETWEWDGSSWELVTPDDPEHDGNPSPRVNHALAYDAARGVTVLFGGSNGGTANNETWEWDGVSWARKTPAGPFVPQPRDSHAMVFDEARGVVVLFGGSSGDAQTWSWDGVSWSVYPPSDPEGDGYPSSRVFHAMVYDSRRAVTVLFGGDDWNPGSLGDLWEWDGVSWERRTPLDPEGDGNPSGRLLAGMAFDKARDRTVMFGGWDTAYNSETWEWDGTSWMKRGPADPQGDGNPPAMNVGRGAAFDSGRGRAVLFGGCTEDWCTAYSDATWEWDGMSWARAAPEDPEGDGNPEIRTEHAMAYDEARGRVVLFGGRSGLTGSVIADTWLWDGTSWAKCVPGGLGCDLGDPGGDGQPGPRTSHAMAYDAARGVVVLFGGSMLVGEYFTWLWDGTSWAKCVAGGSACDLTDPEGDGDPPNLFGPAMAYDSERQVIVLFGGRNDGQGGAPMGDTWEWNGQSWARKTVADPEMDGEPAPEWYHNMIFDGGRGRVVLVESSESGGAQGGAWEWDGTSWARRLVSDPQLDGHPQTRWSGAMVHDSARGGGLMYGGCVNTGGMCGLKFGDTWQWSGGDAARPGEVMQTAFEAAGVDASPTWMSVISTFFSGGVGYPSGVATNGVDLKVWDEGMWKTVATNNSPPNNPQLVTWATTDPQQISRLFYGDQQTLNFAVTPVAPSGTGTGEVSVDYAEVSVKYRMP